MLKDRNLLASSAGGSSNNYRYLRLAVYIGVSNLYELKFYDANGTKHPTQAMTSNTAPAPLAVTIAPNATSIDYRVFDGNDSSLYAYNHPEQNRTITIDLGSEVFNPISGYATLKAYRNSYYADSAITVSSIKASKTGAFAGEEITLWTGSYSFPNATTTTHTFTFV